MNKAFLTQKIDTTPFKQNNAICLTVLLPMFILNILTIFAPLLIFTSLFIWLFLIPIVYLWITYAMWLKSSRNISFLYTLGLFNTVILIGAPLFLKLSKIIFVDFYDEMSGWDGLGFGFLIAFIWFNWLGVAIGSWIAVFRFRKKKLTVDTSQSSPPPELHPTK